MKDVKFQARRSWFRNLERGTPWIRQNSADQEAPEKMLVRVVKEIQG